MKYCFIISILLSSVLTLGNDIKGEKDPNEVRYITNNKRVPNEAVQRASRSGQAWQEFIANNGTWYVSFNEETRLPGIAYGKPIIVKGATPEQKAMSFIQQNLEGFNIPTDQLELKKVVEGKHNTYVNFTQLYQGLQVLNSRLKVKLTENGEVIQFKSDIYNIELSVAPTITPESAIQAGQDGIVGEIVAIHPNPELAVLPIPVNLEMEYHLVYQMEIETIDQNRIPGRYQTLVDANTGKVLSRKNLVVHHGAEDHSDGNEHAPGGPTVTVSATVYEESPLVAPVLNGLPNLDVQQGINNYSTDQNGNISGGIGTGNANVRLSGLWSYVQTNGVTPEFDVSVINGANNISFDSDATVQQLSAYYHVNIVHDYMKTKFPAFTDMDNALQTNVDVAGDCNAFYNGSSINFYLEGNDCTSFATVADVVYHEYGHGINDKYYQDQGGFFQNGAMGEGYADIWAMGITLSPILGPGTSISDPSSYIRRYDIDPKVYPIDIVGEVHADGEIIAGAWWDLGQIWGDVQQMMDLFSESFNATITGPDGDEGDVFVEILVEALQLDDVPANGGDNDITNGTPNDVDIVTAFGIHGITLLSNATIDHDPIMTHNSDEIAIEADVTLVYPWALTGAKMYYQLNNNMNWNEVELVNTSGTEYSTTIPAQPNGTVIGYYLGLMNLDSSLAGVQPIGANLDPYPNVPYYIMVGYETVQFEDFDNEQGDWTEGVPSDGATTGEWVIDIPIPSFSDAGVMVQTDEDVTEGSGNVACALTGNGSVGGGIGENDVDGGKTTLVSPVFDLTQYDDPAITYYRYYTNSPPSGANPGADWWQVELTSDGTNWVMFESTQTSDPSWRRVAFRVADHVDVTTDFQMRFVASDSIRPGQNLDGGSLIEGAVDELYIYEQAEDVGVIELEGVSAINLFPNPATTLLTAEIDLDRSATFQLHILDVTGREVINEADIRLNAGRSRVMVSTKDLTSGNYQLILKNSTGRYNSQFSVVK